MLKQAVISGGVSSELRSAAVKMLFVKEENTSEPEPKPCRIKHEEPEPRIIIKHEEPEPCRIKHEEPETEPEPRIIIKHEEPEPRIIKHEDHGGWSLFFINNDCYYLNNNKPRII